MNGTYIPKARPETQGKQWRQPGRIYSVAAVWADGWEMRHLDWLRFHGLWALNSSAQHSPGKAY